MSVVDKYPRILLGSSLKLALAYLHYRNLLMLQIGFVLLLLFSIEKRKNVTTEFRKLLFLLREREDRLLRMEGSGGR